MTGSRPTLRAHVRGGACHNGDGTVDLHAVTSDGRGVVVTFTAREFLSLVEAGVVGAIQGLKDRIEGEKMTGHVPPASK